MDYLFIQLTHALSQSIGISLCAAMAWGVVSILLSPCHLSSIPLIVGVISGQKDMTTGRAFVLSFLFALGILVTIGIIGVITSLMGRMMGNIGYWGNYLVSGIFILVGLYLLGWVPDPFNRPSGVKVKGKGALAAFMLGLIFGLALGPCTFAFMAPVLATSVQLSSQQPVLAFLLLASYGIGHCSVIVFAGTSVETVQSYLNWNEQSHKIQLIKRVCGVLVILAGVYMLWITKPF